MGILYRRTLSCLPCPSPGDLPNPEIEPRPPTLQVDSLPAEPPGKTTYTHIPAYKFASLVAQLYKESACNAGDPGLIPESGESPGEGIVYKFYICIYIHSPFLHKSWYTINSSFPRFSCLRVCLKIFLYQYTKHFFIKYSIVLLYTVYLTSLWLTYM